MPVASLALHLFGPPRLQRLGAPLPVERRKSLALLAYLAATGQPHTRDALAALLWPDASAARARASLRNALYTLETACNHALFVGDRETVALQPDALAVDLVAFRALLAAGAAHAHPPDIVCSQCLASLQAAVELYQADFMAGFTLRDCVDFDDWQFHEGEQLRQTITGVLKRVVAGHLAQATPEAALAAARRWSQIDPLNEHAHRQIMRICAEQGDRAAALHQYELCARLLEAGVGAPPEPETTALYQAIRTNRNAPPAVPDSGRPTAPQQPAPQATLAPLVGRERELATIDQLLLHTPECRLLTLVGPGGVGKTRLALAAVAAHASHHTAGSHFVSLEAVTAAELLAPTIAASLGFTLNARADSWAQVLDYLAAKDMLLALDNFEQVLDGAPLLAELLARAPHLALLVTSREALNIQGEWLCEIGGLALPAEHETGDLSAYGAPRLFLQSVRRARAGRAPALAEHAAIARICRQVQGLPLAIELAAALTRVLSCAEIADEIAQTYDMLVSNRRDLPERHRSLRAVFTHSWARLKPHEQLVLGQLSVFRGSFTRAAASGVCGQHAPDLVHLFVRLANQSLVQRTPNGMFDLHETVRQYAAEQIAGGDATAARHRHAAYYAALLAGHADALRGHGQIAALREISAQIDNVRVAWRWMVEQHQWSEVATAAASLALLYESRSWFQEGLATFSFAAEQCAAGQGDQYLLAMLLVRQARFAFFSGHHAHADALLARGSELLAYGGDPREQALALNYRGYLERARESYPKAERAFQASLALYEQLGDQWGMARVLNGRGVVAFDLGRYNEALPCFTASLAAFRALGDARGCGLALANLGNIHSAQGRYDQAGACYAESLALFSDLGDQQGIALITNNRGTAAAAAKEYGLARQYHTESLAIKRELGERKGIALSLSNLGDVCRLLGDHAEAEQYLHEGLAICEAIGERGTAARIFSNLGMTLLDQNRLAEAEPYLLSGLALAGETGRLPIMLDLLGELATLLQRNGDQRQARDVLAVIVRHPATSEHQRARLQAQIAEFDSGLGAAEIARRDAWAQMQQIETLVAELVAQRGPVLT